MYMYFMTMYSAVRVPLVSNCAIFIRFIITIIKREAIS